MDGYANTLFANALNTNREGIIFPTDVGALANPPLPTIGSLERVHQLEPWVRTYLAVHELLMPCAFDPQAAGTEGLQLTVAGAAPAVPLATLYRPLRTVFEGELKDVLMYAELRHDRIAEILTQIDSQTAHWSSILQMRPDISEKTLELLQVSLQFAVFIEMRFKHYFSCWRPVNYSHQVQPVITTPGHGSLPMGHATQAYLAAYILDYLTNRHANGSQIDQRVTNMLYRQAFRMSFNRIVAGVHFPVDMAAGAALGRALGQYFVGRCSTVPKTGSLFGVPPTPGPVDVTEYVFNVANYAAGPITLPAFLSKYAGTTRQQTFSSAPVLSAIWTDAHEEWVYRR